MDRDRGKHASEGILPLGITALNETVLSNQPESRHECPICLNWLRDPVITTCGHKFCKTCITSWLQNSGHCPIDNINLSMKVDIFPDNYTKREILEQRMSCPFASKGCKVVVPPLDLDSHISSCEFNQPEQSSQPNVPCTFHSIGCKETFENQDEMNKHLRSALHSHLSLLLNAYSVVKINNDISNASMDAKEQEAMSLWEAPDKTTGESSTEPRNTTALIRALYERVVILEQHNREQDIIINNVTKQLSAFSIAKKKQTDDMLLRFCMGNYIWKIDSFKSRCEQMLSDHCKMLYSPGFYTSPNGYRFCLRLNISPQNPQCFALHVHLMKTEYDECLDWPFNGRISFAMINQIDPDLTQKDTMMSNSNLIAFRKPTTEICVRGFGYTEYALVSDVFRNGFVKDDVLIIRVCIKFCLRLNISPQNPQCFALHVHLMKTEYDECLDWPFNGRISFAMINQIDLDLTQKDTMMSNSNLIAFRKPTTEICVRGFGYTEYALVSDVFRNGFVKDDVLIIRVCIKCV